MISLHKLKETMAQRIPHHQDIGVQPLIASIEQNVTAISNRSFEHIHQLTDLVDALKMTLSSPEAAPLTAEEDDDIWFQVVQLWDASLKQATPDPTLSDTLFNLGQDLYTLLSTHTTTTTTTTLPSILPLRQKMLHMSLASTLWRDRQHSQRAWWCVEQSLHLGRHLQQIHLDNTITGLETTPTNPVIIIIKDVFQVYIDAAREALSNPNNKSKAVVNNLLAQAMHFTQHSVVKEDSSNSVAAAMVCAVVDLQLEIAKGQIMKGGDDGGQYSAAMQLLLGCMNHLTTIHTAIIQSQRGGGADVEEEEEARQEICQIVVAPIAVALAVAVQQVEGYIKQVALMLAECYLAVGQPHEALHYLSITETIGTSGVQQQQQKQTYGVAVEDIDIDIDITTTTNDNDDNDDDDVVKSAAAVLKLKAHLALHQYTEAATQLSTLLKCAIATYMREINNYDTIRVDDVLLRSEIGGGAMKPLLEWTEQLERFVAAAPADVAEECWKQQVVNALGSENDDGGVKQQQHVAVVVAQAMIIKGGAQPLMIKLATTILGSQTICSTIFKSTTTVRQYYTFLNNHAVRCFDLEYYQSAQLLFTAGLQFAVHSTSARKKTITTLAAVAIKLGRMDAATEYIDMIIPCGISVNGSGEGQRLGVGQRRKKEVDKEVSVVVWLLRLYVSVMIGTVSEEELLAVLGAVMKCADITISHFGLLLDIAGNEACSPSFKEKIVFTVLQQVTVALQQQNNNSKKKATTQLSLIGSVFSKLQHLLLDSIKADHNNNTTNKTSQLPSLVQVVHQWCADTLKSKGSCSAILQGFASKIHLATTMIQLFFTSTTAGDMDIDIESILSWLQALEPYIHELQAPQWACVVGVGIECGIKTVQTAVVELLLAAAPPTLLLSGNGNGNAATAYSSSIISLETCIRILTRFTLCPEQNLGVLKLAAHSTSIGQVAREGGDASNGSTSTIEIEWLAKTAFNSGLQCMKTSSTGNGGSTEQYFKLAERFATFLGDEELLKNVHHVVCMFLKSDVVVGTKTDIEEEVGKKEGQQEEIAVVVGGSKTSRPAVDPSSHSPSIDLQQQQSQHLLSNNAPPPTATTTAATTPIINTLHKNKKQRTATAANTNNNQNKNNGSQWLERVLAAQKRVLNPHRDLHRHHQQQSNQQKDDDVEEDNGPSAVVVELDTKEVAQSDDGNGGGNKSAVSWDLADNADALTVSSLQ